MIWYFDVISPFAYLALPEVEALGPVSLRPILFGAVLKHWGQLGPAEIAPKRIHTYRLVAFQAARRQVPFRFPPTHPFNPLQALRLLTALDAPPGAVRIALDVVWAEGIDVSTPEGFVHLAERLDVPDPAALIDRTGAKDRLRAATEDAIARGVFGVPTLAVADDLFWGVDALPMARAAMADPALFQRGEMARIEGLGSLQRSLVARPAG